MGTHFGHLYLQVASAQVRSYRARLGHINMQTRKDTKQHIEHIGRWAVPEGVPKKRQSGQGWWQECVGSTELHFVNGFDLLWADQHSTDQHRTTCTLWGWPMATWDLRGVVKSWWRRLTIALGWRGLLGCPTVAKHTHTHFFECLHMIDGGRVMHQCMNVSKGVKLSCQIETDAFAGRITASRVSHSALTESFASSKRPFTVPIQAEGCCCANVTTWGSQNPRRRWCERWTHKAQSVLEHRLHPWD